MLCGLTMILVISNMLVFAAAPAPSPPSEKPAPEDQPGTSPPSSKSPVESDEEAETKDEFTAITCNNSSEDKTGSAPDQMGMPGDQNMSGPFKPEECLEYANSGSVEAAEENAKRQIANYDEDDEEDKEGEGEGEGEGEPEGAAPAPAQPNPQTPPPAA